MDEKAEDIPDFLKRKPGVPDIVLLNEPLDLTTPPDPNAQVAVTEITWDDKQREAIAACCDLKKRIVAVTGAAGTGKTTLMRIVYEQLVAAGYRVALAAPTGKAAKR